MASLPAAALVSCGVRPGAEYRFLTAEEATLLGACCDRIIPPDSAPGARQAHVVHFIDLQLTRKYKAWQPAYRDGLARLKAAKFAELPAGQQTALLEAWERGEPEQRRFFEMVLAHTMQGYYGSPRHGGNRDGASWRMLGVPNPPVRGRLHYEV